ALHDELVIGDVFGEPQRAAALDVAGAALPRVEQVDVSVRVDLVHQEIGVVRGAHLDAHRVALLIDRIVPAPGPELGVEAARARRRSRRRREEQARGGESGEAGKGDSSHGELLVGVAPATGVGPAPDLSHGCGRGAPGSWRTGRARSSGLPCAVWYA